ncbi:mitochondrial 54S ribosomal protein YmL3 [Sugiyamaella lignohabitans]|uniref:Large ribosomal subunit protein mL44 n=1 Tax=Sugiyamaella lignohabitans TaxID=796027 RepID=A0A167DAL8_9ASCO|nr:mitochondrial 54S ribosomal protein YmL3 [Sugiyamaella lignohabitans]ANB12683.1 mitochondrial 54S ribosomal protein YmL3 [Sugiyamaella lignohabitans]
MSVNALRTNCGSASLRAAISAQSQRALASLNSRSAGLLLKNRNAGSLSQKRFQTTATASSKATYKSPENPFNFGAYARSEEVEAIPESLASKIPALRALHARLGLSEKFLYSTLARALICRSSNVKFADNVGLANFGKSVLSFYVYEYFLVKYPRLPHKVLRHVVELYTSLPALSKLGTSWGVEPDSRSSFTRYLAEQSDEDVLGRLLFTENLVQQEPGVVQVVDSDKNHVDFNEAMASFVRSLVAGVYAHGGLEEARDFIHKYIILPRKVDMASIMSFDKPTRELAVLCSREGLEQPVSRLLAETGRYSKAPVFVVGVFSGSSKLGEGQGASLNEARTRAAVHALKAWYLYSPINSQLPSDHNESTEFKPAFIDTGAVVI